MIKKRSQKNLITGLIYQIVNTLLALILPRLFITSLGSETNGLLGSIGQLFVYLGLLEAGVGAASLQALYKPLAEDDKDEINSILSATNHYYNKTGLLYAGSILLMAIAYPYLVDSHIDAPTIRLVIILQGVGQVVAYFTQAKYTLLLQAEGKSYIINSLAIAGTILRNTGKIVALALGYGVIAVQIVHLLVVCINAAVIVIYTRRKCPWLNLHFMPNYEAISQKTSVLIQSVAWIVFNHTDILVLTFATRDLALVSVYTVYALLFEAVQNVVNAVRESFQYKIGYYSQSDRDKLSSYFCRYSTIIYSLTFASFAVCYILAMPFMRLYTDGVTDADYLLPYLPALFMSYKILYCVRATNRQLIEVGGHFKSTQKIAIREAVINITASLTLVFPLRIYGVLMGTLASLLYGCCAYIRFVRQNVLDRSYRITLLMQIINIFALIPVIIIHREWQIAADNYVNLIFGLCKPIALVVLLFALLTLIQLRVYKRITQNSTEGF